ncbi:response regulator [bacterium]|nr:response regulator [bacterium]
MKDILAIIIDKDPTANEVIKQILDDNSKIKETKQFLKLEDGYDFSSTNKPDLIFIDIEYGEDLTFDIISKIKKENKNCKIVLLSRKAEAKLLIKSKKAGSDRLLLKPVLKNDFDDILTKLINEINYKSDNINTKIISVFSNKGGVGKTTISTNLAIQIYEMTQNPTVIVDFNSQFGDVSTFLDVKTDFGISYLLSHKEQINKDFLFSILPRYKDTELFVLSDIFYLNDVKELSLEDVQDIIDALKSTFSYIIIDMTNVYDLKTMKILDNSNDILFPFVANMPNLRNCLRCLNFFKKLGYEDKKVKLILNRVTESDEIKSDTIELTLNKKLYARLKNDYYIVMSAINRGVGISDIDEKSDIANSFQNLAYSLIKDEEE